MKDYFNTLKKNSWLHMYQMENISNSKYFPLILTKGKDIYVYDDSGNKYIDGISGAYCVNIGYGRTNVLKAAFESAKMIHYVSPFSYANYPSIMLAEKLNQIASPIVGDENRVFFVNSGAEAVETAVKAAIAYSRRTIKPNAYKIICRDKAYHGTTLGTMALSGFESLRQDYGPGFPGIYHAAGTNCTRCPLNLRRDSCNVACASTIEKIILEQDPSTVAAILIEPLETSSGIIPPPLEYLEKVYKICKDTNTILILDEVITGFGRLGYWFGAEKYKLQADIVVVSKGLTSGYDSLGAAIVSKKIADIFLGEDKDIFTHASTFGGRPGAAAAALEVIKVIEKEDLLENVKIVTNFLHENLIELSKRFPMLGEIRYAGLLFGIDLIKANGELINDLPLIHKIRYNLLKNGLITSLYYSTEEPIIELAPPLSISINQCEKIIKSISTSLKSV